MHFYFIKRIQDVGNYTNATDVPFRFVPCMVAGLAYYLAMKYTPQLIQQNKLIYEDELQRALAEDGSASSTYITPKVYYPEYNVQDSQQVNTQKQYQTDLVWSFHIKKWLENGMVCLYMFQNTNQSNHN